MGSVLGAFAISILGSAYSRLCNGYAFAAMVPGVLLLVPTGLIAVGGLAQNYSSNDDQFASGLATGLAMIQSMCIAIQVAPHSNIVVQSKHRYHDWALPCRGGVAFVRACEGTSDSRTRDAG